MIETLIRSALDSGVRGRPVREVAPLKHSRYGNFFFLDNILGSAARNDVDRNISETVKKGENRQRMQAEGFALSTPTIL